MGGWDSLCALCGGCLKRQCIRIGLDAPGASKWRRNLVACKRAALAQGDGFDDGHGKATEGGNEREKSGGGDDGENRDDEEDEEDGDDRDDENNGHAEDAGENEGEGGDGWRPSRHDEFAYDPELITERDIAWLSDTGCLGLNPDAEGDSK